MKRNLFFVLLLGCAMGLMAQTEPLKQKLEIRLDSIGNANFKDSMTMNATQWQVWLHSVGNNPAVMKRMMERALPGYFLDDFDLQKNDMERSFEFIFKAYGVCEIDRHGKWIMNTEEKNADITTLSERKFMMVTMDTENNIQNTQYLDFPKEAKNIIISQDAYDNTQFEFDMASPGPQKGWMLWSGIGLLLLGGGWLAAGRLRK